MLMIVSPKMINIPIKKEAHVCSICGKTYYEFPNNAAPVTDGNCCDECNMNYVIPARIKLSEETEDANNHSSHA